MEREGIIQPWHDRRIVAGTEFEAEISVHLEQARIILLLVSPDFIASEYSWKNEMTRALERHRAGEARVIPIVLRPVDWHTTPFGKLQALPKDGKPVSIWPDPDEALLDVARGIRVAATELRSPRYRSGRQAPTARPDSSGGNEIRSDEPRKNPDTLAFSEFENGQGAATAMKGAVRHSKLAMLIAPLAIVLVVKFVFDHLAETREVPLGFRETLLVFVISCAFVAACQFVVRKLRSHVWK